MTQALFYSSNAVAMTLAASISSGDVTCSLSSATGLPASFPFKLLIGWGTGQQEVVHCTALSGVIATITRGQDGTTAQSHSIGASVVHGVSAREFNDLEAHVAASSGVHGLAGAVVGTTDTQTLTNKTLTSPVITFGGQSLSGAWTAYTPALSAITTAPTIGNGSITGSYLQVGKTVTFDIRINIGTTTTLGSGAWKLGLPVAPLSQAINATAFLDHSGASQSFVAGTDLTTVGGQATIILYTTDGTTFLDNTNTRLASGAFVVVAGTYQTA